MFNTIIDVQEVFENLKKFKTNPALEIGLTYLIEKKNPIDEIIEVKGGRLFNVLTNLGYFPFPLRAPSSKERTAILLNESSQILVDTPKLLYLLMRMTKQVSSLNQTRLP